MSRQALGTWIVTATMLSLFAAVGTAQPVLSQTKSPKKYEATIGVGGPAVELAWPVLVADQMGYFTEQGIEVTQLITAPGPTLAHSFTNGQIDFLAAGISSPINMRAGGVPVKSILEFNAKEILQLAARSGLKDDVKSVRDLKGRTVGYLGAGGLAWMGGLVALKSAGLDPDRGDVKFINVGGTPAELITALQQGKIDAAPLWEPILTRALRDRFAYVILSSADTQQHRQWWGTDRIQDLALVTTEGLIKKQPELVKGMTAALKKALTFIQSESPEKIVDVVLAHPRGNEWWGNLDRDVMLGSTRTAKTLLGNGCLSRASFTKLIDLLIEYQIVKKRVTFDEYADTSWAGVCAD